MNIDLTGKTAIISGSTAGIGLGIASGLARPGRRSSSTAGRRTPSTRRSRRCRDAVPEAAVRGFAADLGEATGTALRVDGGTVDKIA